MAIINQIVGNKKTQETLRIVLIGSHGTVTDAIHILHHIDFSHATDWCRIQPTPNEGEFVSLLMRKL